MTAGWRSLVAAPAEKNFSVLLGPGLRARTPAELASRFELRRAVWSVAGKAETLDPGKAKEPSRFPGEGLNWVGLEDTYFLSADRAPSAGGESSLSTGASGSCRRRAHISTTGPCRRHRRRSRRRQGAGARFPARDRGSGRPHRGHVLLGLEAARSPHRLALRTGQDGQTRRVRLPRPSAALQPAVDPCARGGELWLGDHPADDRPQDRAAAALALGLQVDAQDAEAQSEDAGCAGALERETARQERALQLRRAAADERRDHGSLSLRRGQPSRRLLSRC